MNNEQLNKFQIFEDLSDENLSLFHDILKVVAVSYTNLTLPTTPYV